MVDEPLWLASARGRSPGIHYITHLTFLCTALTARGGEDHGLAARLSLSELSALDCEMQLSGPLSFVHLGPETISSTL